MASPDESTRPTTVIIMVDLSEVDMDDPEAIRRALEEGT